ncbi:5'-3' exoribonuclease, partial [Trifolium medium]|nr:5'-3' exoribonuclease [Trifolium medium]
MENIKRRKRQTRGDDIGPQVQPESLAAISPFHGSRLASPLMPSPFQQSGHNKEVLEKPRKVSRLSSGATVASAIVED